MRKLRQTRLQPLRRLTASASAMALLLASTAQAAPVLPGGGAVTAGTASITQPAPGGALIVQQSQKAVINWQNFSIGAGASVTFQQPNASAITLNRVVGPDASAINGNLTANGQVWLLNGNGILFGKGSSINVGGLIATTSDLKDGDFLSGNYAFSGASANPNAAVVNQGSIKAATGGAVVLSGTRVVNDGAIKARLGKVVLGGASAFSVDFDGDNLIRYQVTAPVAQTPNGPDGKPAPALVSNRGTIAAAGGTILMTARAARNVVDNVINSSGIVEAKSASVQNGEVVFDAGDGGTVRIAGTVDVSGTKPGQTGGAITVIGDTVAVADGARLNASGDAGGGTVLVGGNLHGAGPLPNAQTVSVGNAVIAADAITSGKGGTVAITSTGQTNVAAAISARGGAAGGDGGTVETSGQDLSVTGVRVDASAAAGASGLWLLDPTNVTIDSATATTIVSMLDDNHTDVLVQADNNITVNAPVTYASANSLTLLAGSGLTFNAGVQNSGTGAIFGVAGWDGITPVANILTTPGAYGHNQGTVVIGTGSANGGVAVGSRGGATTIAAYDLAVAASSGYAQLGYHGSAGSGIATGAITVDLTADLILAGSSNSSGKFAQIGHGGYQLSNNSNAPITIMAAGTIQMGGGSGGGAYVLIGNGGFGGGSQAGNITISAGANVVMAGGSGSVNPAQIGNSGSAISGTVLLASAGNITLGAGSSLNASAAGDALVVAAGGDIINQSGSGVFNVSGGGRWLAFLNAPSPNTGGLSALPYYNRVFNFLTDTYAAVTSAGNRFVYALAPVVTIAIDSKSKVYGSANPTLTATVSGGLPGDPPASVYTGAPALSTTATAHSNAGDYAITGTLGTLVSDFNYAFQFVNGVLHIDPAALTASLTGTVQKVYDGTLTAAPAAANYQFTGLVPGDSISLNDPLGTYDTKNVGSGKTVSVSGLALVGANKDNYVLTSTNASGNVGTITAATLAASLSGTVQKTYDGSTAATLTSDNYQLSGVISEDSVTLNNPSSGTYDTKNVGSGKTVSVGGLALQGADKNNYVLASTSISGAVGEIDAATLTASLSGTVQKTYDGNTGATLTSDNYQLSGVVSEDNVTLNNPASGTYDTRNVGSEKTVSVSGLALVGANKDNYVLTSTNASGNVGTITAATLAASLSGTVQKTYDGSTAATLTSGNYQLSGVISEDSVTLNNPASGTYDTRNVGSEKTVSVGGLALQGADKNNYVLASTSISGAVGEIDAATLTASLTGTVQKTYDGNTAATLTSGNYQLSGVISEDSVTLNNPASGTYDTRNVGSEKTVSVGGLALQGADKNNYVLASTSISGAIGEIDVATLTASLTGTVQKPYDGNASATLAAGNYQLTGVVSGDGVTLNNPANGAYDTPDAGTGKTVSVGGLALLGSDRNNYVLASSNISANIGVIGAILLTANLTGTVQKTYDGTTAATLAAGNYQLAGVVSGDSVALNDPSSGLYDTKNAGSEKTVSVSGLALQGADKNNYVLASTSISGAVGIITAATLTTSLTGTVQKTYDGTTAATLAAGNYRLSGVISEDNVTLNNPASGSYDTRNVGSEKTVSVSGLALQGADKGNYVLASSNISAAIGSINAATLTASLTGTVQKVYDGTVSAVLTAANYLLAGAVSGDSVTLNNPAAGTLDTRNVGAGKTVSVSGVALQGADKGNYVLASSNISAAIGSITAATLTASLTGTVQKTYDGTTTAALAAGNYQLAGAISGDSVSLSGPASGSYDNKNVGSEKIVSVGGLALQGADKGNYVLASSNISAAIGSITAATLTASLTGPVQKTYDGTTTAALAPGSYHLAGVVSGDNVLLSGPASGSYDTKNVGAGKTVSVGGVTLQGADQGNYVLASSNLSAAIGSITAATLTASLTGSVQKPYDGTTTATLAAGNFQFAGLISGDSVSLSAPTGGSYDSKNAGSGKTVSVNGVALQGADKGNYVLASSNLSAAIGTITPATLTASLTGTVQKVYDGAVSAILSATNYLLSGVLGGDSVSLNNPPNGSFASADAGTGKTISVSGLVLQGADQSNYVLASSTISGPIGTITPSQTTPDVVRILGNTFTSGSVSGPQSPVAPTAPPAAAPPTTSGGSQTSSTSSDATYATASGGDTPAPSDAAASKVGQSLSGAPGGVPSSTYVVIQGLLRQFSPPPGGARPHGVPPFGQVYSSWGNEAFWQ